MKAEARINKLEKRAQAILEKKIIVCKVEKEKITYDGKEYTPREWEAWKAENINADDTVINVSMYDEDLKTSPGSIRLGIDYDEL